MNSSNNHSEVECTIVDADTDIYGHLNGENLPRIFRKGRIALQESLGIGERELRKRGIIFGTIRQVYDQYKKLFPTQKVTVFSHFKPYERRASFEIEHEMYCNGVLVATSETKHTFIDLETGKPIRPLEELVSQLK